MKKSSNGARVHARVREFMSSKIFQGFASLVLILALWWAVTAAGLVNPLYLPSPAQVAGAFVEANTTVMRSPRDPAASYAANSSTSCGSTCS